MVTATDAAFQTGGASSLQKAFAKFFFGGDEKTELMRELGEMMDSGFALNLSLKQLWMVYSKDGKEANAAIPIMLADWHDKLSKGEKFHEAIAGWFPHAERMIFLAAESGGSMSGKNPLGEAFRTVAAVSEVVEKIKATAWGSLKPIIILIMMTLVMLGIYAYMLVPQFESIRPPGKEWSGIAYSVVLVGDLTKILITPVLIGLGVFCLFCIWSFKRLTGRIRVILDDRWPWSIYRMVVGSQFTLAAAAMLSSGAADKTVLELFEEDADPYLLERIQGMRVYVKEGKDLGFAMRQSGFNFPDRKIIDKLRIYSAMSADFGGAITKVGNQWLRDGADIIKKRVEALEARLNMALSAIVAWQVVGGTFMQLQLFEWMKGGGM